MTTVREKKKSRIIEEKGYRVTVTACWGEVKNEIMKYCWGHGFDGDHASPQVQEDEGQSQRLLSSFWSRNRIIFESLLNYDHEDARTERGVLNYLADEICDNILPIEGMDV